MAEAARGGGLRLVPLLLGLAMAGCGAPSPTLPTAPISPPPQAPASVPADAAACQVGPNGGAPAAAWMADRGIGGTGGPAAIEQADRGIGGTGIDQTGLLGEITGFASVCLDGREVALDPATPVTIEGVPTTAADLRAGQIAAIQAYGPPGALRAMTIAVRLEVSGPVEAVAADGGLRVAGQAVALSAQTRGSVAPRVGDWVGVSGLRGPDGVIHASRVDPRPAGSVIVHGLLEQAGGRLRIGPLEVRMPPGVPNLAGRLVTVSGREVGGILFVDIVRPDLLLADPGAYFGPGASVLVLEGYAESGRGVLRFGRGLVAPVAGGIGPFGARRAIVAFRRQGGGFEALSVGDPVRGPGVRGGRQGGRGFEPAPLPDRGFGPREGRGGGFGPGVGRGERSRYGNGPGPGGGPGFGPGPGPGGGGADRGQFGGQFDSAPGPRRQP
jgi:hypothetical protein